MLKNKARIFAHGLRLFAIQWCAGQKHVYVERMTKEDGYLHAVKQFYIKLGYLTKEERDLVFIEGKIPQWIQNLFIEVEHQMFGESIWNQK